MTNVLAQDYKRFAYNTQPCTFTTLSLQWPSPPLPPPPPPPQKEQCMMGGALLGSPIVAGYSPASVHPSLNTRTKVPHQ